MFCTKILHVMSMILKTILSASAVHVLVVKKKRMYVRKTTVGGNAKGYCCGSQRHNILLKPFCAVCMYLPFPFRRKQDVFTLDFDVDAIG